MIAGILATLLTSGVAATSAEAIVEAVEAKYKTVEGIQADFVQTTESKMFGVQNQTGNMVVSRPAQMRWNFEGDKPQQFITNGSVMWIHSPAEKQALKYEDVSSASADATSVLQSLDTISDTFEIAVLVDSPTSKRLSLTPKSGIKQVKRIELGLDGDLMLTDVMMVDAFDTETKIAFGQVKLNPTVDPSIFAFVPPEGTKVIAAQ